MSVELIIFVGLQAAGKSTYYRDHLSATHVHVSKDLMKNTRDKDTKQRSMISQALAAGKSVVVDNTNPTVAARAPLIGIGHAQGARVVAYFFDITPRQAIARNHLREGKAHVPPPAIYLTAKKLVPPSLEEGFDEVRVISTGAVTA